MTRETNITTGTENGAGPILGSVSDRQRRTLLANSSLIALMKDQVDSLRANGIAADFINSSLSPTEVSRVRARALSGETKILYLAPERLALSGFQHFLNTLKVSLIAIDEAHCISEWGHDFRPDYRNLRSLRTHLPDVPLIALTATATERVCQDIIDQLELRQPRTFLASLNRSNLSYLVRPKRKSFDALLDLLEKHRGKSAIVYCFSRKDTESLATALSHQGFEALPYHTTLVLTARCAERLRRSSFATRSPSWWRPSHSEWASTSLIYDS